MTLENLKKRLWASLRHENILGKYYRVSLKPLYKQSLSFKAIMNVITVVSLSIFFLTAYLSSNSPRLASFLLCLYLIFLARFFYKRIKRKYFYSGRPNEGILRNFIYSNGLYEESNGFLKSEIHLGYVDYGEEFSVIFGKNGDRYQDNIEKLGQKLESALDYDLVSEDNMTTYYSYNFRKAPLERKIINNDFSSVDDDNLVIEIYGDIRLDLRKNISSLVSGKSGGGKSYFVFYMLKSYLEKYTFDDEGRKVYSSCYCIDPKQSDLFKMFKFSGYPDNRYGDTVSDAFKIVREVTEEMERRKEIYSESNAFDVCMVELGYPPLLLLIDEYSSLVEMMDNKQRSDWDKLIGNLLRLSRQLSIGVWLVSQSPSAKTFGDSGVRAQLVNNFYMGMPDQQGSLMMFNRSAKELPLINGVGEGLASIDGLDVVKFLSPTFSINVEEAILPVLRQSANYLKEPEIDWNDLI